MNAKAPRVCYEAFCGCNGRSWKVVVCSVLHPRHAAHGGSEWKLLFNFFSFHLHLRKETRHEPVHKIERRKEEEKVKQTK